MNINKILLVNTIFVCERRAPEGAHNEKLNFKLCKIPCQVCKFCKIEETFSESSISRGREGYRRSFKDYLGSVKKVSSFVQLHTKKVFYCCVEIETTFSMFG